MDSRARYSWLGGTSTLRMRLSHMASFTTWQNGMHTETTKKCPNPRSSLGGIRGIRSKLQVVATQLSGCYTAIRAYYCLKTWSHWKSGRKSKMHPASHEDP